MPESAKPSVYERFVRELAVLECRSGHAVRIGVARSLGDLQRQEHRTIHFEMTLGARPFGWEYPDGETYATLQLPGALHVNSAQT